MAKIEKVEVETEVETIVETEVETKSVVEETELTNEERLANAIWYKDSIGDIDNELLGMFIKDYIGSTKIAEFEKNLDDKKVTRDFSIVMSDFPIVALIKYLDYGTQRVHNDSHGGEIGVKFDSTEAKMDSVFLQIEEFKVGIIKKSRASAKPITDLTTLARKKAKAFTKILYDESTDLDYKIDFLDSQTTSEQNEYLDGVIRDDDQFIIAAQAELDGRETAKESVDLSSLPKRKS